MLQDIESFSSDPRSRRGVGRSIGPALESAVPYAILTETLRASMGVRLSIGERTIPVGGSLSDERRWHGVSSK